MKSEKYDLKEIILIRWSDYIDQMIIGNKSDLSGRVVGYDQASSFATEVVEKFADLKWLLENPHGVNILVSHHISIDHLFEVMNQSEWVLWNLDFGEIVKLLVRWK